MQTCKQVNMFTSKPANQQRSKPAKYRLTVI